MNVLVTGGAGFIGSHLCERLIDDGHKVICYDNFTGSVNRDFKWKNISSLKYQNKFELVDVDILVEKDVNKVFSENIIDCVFHLAAKTGIRPSVQDPVLHYNVNVMGLLNLLRACNRNNVKKFVFASSSSIYGNSPNVPFKETDKVDTQLSPYAATKKAGENLLHVFHWLYGFDVACLRPFTVYGPRQRKDMAISLFTRKINNGENITIFGNETNKRDYTYVDDVVDGFMKAMYNLRGFEVYNIGCSNPVDLNHIVGIIKHKLNKDISLDHSPMQPGEAIITHADITKARNYLGYDPKIKIEEGIIRYIEWYLDEIK